MDLPKFTNIDYRGIDQEQKQLFKDYYFYDYKNFNFGKILDKHGDRINNDFNSFIQNNVDYRYLNSNSFRFPFIYDEEVNKASYQHAINKWATPPPKRFLFDFGVKVPSHYDKHEIGEKDWNLNPANKYIKGLYNREMTNKYETSMNGQDIRLDDGSIIRPYEGNIRAMM